jgi:hypothetical protein
MSVGVEAQRRRSKSNQCRSTFERSSRWGALLNVRFLDRFAGRPMSDLGPISVMEWAMPPLRVVTKAPRGGYRSTRVAASGAGVAPKPCDPLPNYDHHQTEQ